MFESFERSPKAWTSECAWDWYKSRPRPFGVNFVPSYACNSTEMWMPETYNLDTLRRELGWIGGAGFNCIRVFCQYIVWQQQGYAFMDRFETLLDLAHTVGLSVIPVLLDDCSFAGVEPFIGWQPEPQPGVHNACWTASPGARIVDDLSRYASLREYVQSMLQTWGKDERVLFWDLYNEPGNCGRGADSLFLLERVFDWARACSIDQPLTAAAWTGSDVSPGVRFCQYACLALSDFLTFHQYADAAALQNALDTLRPLGLPVVCTEWFARTVGSTYETHLPVFRANEAGCVQWGFVNGRTQTHIPPGWDPADGEPPVWYHDNIRPDGSWYNFLDQAALRHFADDLNWE